MTTLLVIISWAVPIVMGFALWRAAKRAQYRELEYYIAEFVAVVQDIRKDPDMPGEIKDFYLRIARQIDDKKLARDLVNDIEHDLAKGQNGKNAIDRDALPRLQYIKTIKASLMFFVALSYSYPRKGYILREFILGMDEKPAVLERRVYETTFGHQLHAA